MLAEVLSTSRRCRTGQIETVATLVDRRSICCDQRVPKCPAARVSMSSPLSSSFGVSSASIETLCLSRSHSTRQWFGVRTSVHRRRSVLAAPGAADDLHRQQEQRGPRLRSARRVVNQCTQRQVEVGAAGLLEQGPGGAGQFLEASNVEVSGDSRIDGVIGGEGRRAAGPRRLGGPAVHPATDGSTTARRGASIVIDLPAWMMSSSTGAPTRDVQVDHCAGTPQIQQAVPGAQIEQRPLPLADPGRSIVGGVGTVRHRYPAP